MEGRRAGPGYSQDFQDSPDVKRVKVRMTDGLARMSDRLPAPLPCSVLPSPCLDPPAIRPWPARLARNGRASCKSSARHERDGGGSRRVGRG